MPYTSFGPIRDDSLERAKQQILKMLMREEMTKRQGHTLDAESASGSFRRLQGIPRYSDINARSRLPSVDTDAAINATEWWMRPQQPSLPVHGGINSRYTDDLARLIAAWHTSQVQDLANLAPPDTTSEIFQDHDTFDAGGSGPQLAQAVPMPSPLPIPVPLPPITNPGSQENQEWVRWITKLLRKLGRSLPGGEPDCYHEWNDARNMCGEELAKPNPSRQITGGYTNLQDCARGLVSERCGGNRVERQSRQPRNRWRIK